MLAALARYCTDSSASTLARFIAAYSISLPYCWARRLGRAIATATALFVTSVVCTTIGMYFGDDASSSSDSADTASAVRIDETDCNVIAMSEAGKPIYARFPTKELARICGLIQAIRTSLVDPRMGLGDIQSLRSGSLRLVFMTVHSITLMAVARLGKHGEAQTDAYLRLELEYVYGQMLLTSTEQVQQVFLQNPNFDLRESMGASESLITGILDEAAPTGKGCGSFLAGGIDSVFPIAPEVRDNASRVLYNIGEHTDNTVFAMLLTGTKLLTIVQPRHVPHQITSFDLHLLMNFVNSRPGLLTSELWFPICLPRFNSSGFLHVYTNCLDINTKLMLVLLSQSNTTEQFKLFRKAAFTARENLGLPQVIGNVLRILDGKSGTGPASLDDVKWRRSLDFDEEDYVDASLDGGGMIPYVFKDSPPHVTTNAAQSKQSMLLMELESARNAEITKTILEECCAVAQAKHFLFRLDAPVQTTELQVGKLTQCLSSPLDLHFQDASSKRRAHTIYQKLQLRLRLGSATCESSMDAFDKVAHVQAVSEEEHMQGIGRNCPASCLAESPPSVQGVTYVIDGSELFLAMNGREFEL